MVCDKAVVEWELGTGSHLVSDLARKSASYAVFADGAVGWEPGTCSHLASYRA